MMSSEEESKCSGLYGDKLLKKRQRQRVDAGEPRNSYSSIPNFSSRPTFLSGSPYDSLFGQGPQPIGLLGQGFGSAKMLNEFLGRQMKTASEAGGVDSVADMDCYNSGVMIPRGLDEDSPELAHHMLRDILQGRKKDLLGLDVEMANAEHDPVNNNNTALANNNDLKNGDSSDASEVVSVSASAAGASGKLVEDSVRSTEDNSDRKVEAMDVTVNGDNAGESDFEGSIHSTATDLRSPKDGDEDADMDDDKKSLPPTVELKRQRVENIVSTMTRASPLPVPVNGCKKRKLYQPQQHDAGLGVTLSSIMLDDTDDSDPTVIKQKHTEKDVLEKKLRNMREQLAEMHHKYAQLCNRIEQESDVQEVEDTASDVEPEVDQDVKPEDQDQDHDPDNSLSLSEKTVKESPPSTPAKEAQPLASAPVTPSSATSPVVKQLAPPKIHPHHGNPMFPPHPMQLALLQQQQHHLNPEHTGFQHHAAALHSHHPGHSHPSALSTAAMYLNVSQKLFMEQEARLAREAAAAAAAAEPRPHQERSSHPPPSQQPPPQHHPGHPHPLHHQNHPQSQQQAPHHQKDFSERFSMFRNAPVDLEGLSDMLKTEISSSVVSVVDSIMTRFAQHRRYLNKQCESAAEQFNKDLLLAQQLIDRKSPRTKVIDRLSNGPDQRDGPRSNASRNGSFSNIPHPSNNPASVSNNTGTPNSQSGSVNANNNNNNSNTPENNINALNLPPQIRPSPMFQTPKLPSSAAAAALYSMSSMGSHVSPFCLPPDRDREGVPEQNEALSLVTNKKRRHKVTDTRITPRTVSRILGHDTGIGGPPIETGSTTPQLPPQGTPRPSTPTQQQQQQQQAVQAAQVKYGLLPSTSSGSESPSPSQRTYHPSMSLPTTVAIPNPGLHESQVFSPYSPFYTHPSQLSASPPLRDSPPSFGPQSMLPVIMAAAHAHHAGSPHAEKCFDYGNLGRSSGLDNFDHNSDCNPGDGPFDSISPSISFYNRMCHDDTSSLTGPYSSTLTPMHLRKAKLMFFWVRYPSSTVLKMYFPDIKFNKNNTAQLVKWFSNFREFYYIQMEKYARQAVSEGIKREEDLHIGEDSEIFRVLNLHYNRNNHIEVPQNFQFVVEQTLKEFYKAIQGGKDSEPSWKKSIYKVISRLDDPVPERFKTPSFLEQLE